MVKCTLLVPVEIPGDENYNMYFDIEENHCPGTGLVGSVIREEIEKGDEKCYCWACKFEGKNEIIEIKNKVK